MPRDLVAARELSDAERAELVEVEGTLRLTFLGLSDDGKPQFSAKLELDNSVLQADFIEESSAKATFEEWWRGGGDQQTLQAFRDQAFRDHAAMPVNLVSTLGARTPRGRRAVRRARARSPGRSTDDGPEPNDLALAGSSA